MVGASVAREDSGTERKKLLRAGTLHWFHWAVVGASILLTFGAWSFATSQLEERASAQFDREADQVVELIVERMQKYEDGLWGGVGAIQAQGGEISHDAWLTFAHTLRLDEKYPGINGIGVIDHIGLDEAPAYLARHRLTRPDFEIHPAHQERELLPIVYIEPVEMNRAAVGLDIAHERTRYAGAQRARDTGLAQVTGPIVLVQDAQRTPGFLFYVPFYRGAHDTVEARRRNFLGMVYAPFVMRRLMEGTLSRENRHVGVRIQDGTEVLYNEHLESEHDYDADPLYTTTVDAELYGRTWTFELRSNQSFRTATVNHQPLTILVGGLVIDLMLLALFVGISRANRRALAYADAAKAELEARKEQLERSNADLEQFAYVSSHDLQEPLRMVASYCELIRDRLEGKLDPKTDKFIGYVVEGAHRMQSLLDDLLEYSRVNAGQAKRASVDCNGVVNAVVQDLKLAIEEAGATVQVDDLPRVEGNEPQLRQLFQNLIANAVKFRSERPPMIRVYADEKPRDGRWAFHVRDNGIGMLPEHSTKIFQMFQRLHERGAFAGTGVGLTIVKRIVERHGGDISVESAPGQGSTFSFSLPCAPAAGASGLELAA